MVATRPEMPDLSRLKSIRRNFRLCPPPWWRIVKSPVLRRPPVRLRIDVSGLYGRSVVRSSLTTVEVKRSDGVIGRYVLIGIGYSLFLTLAPVVATSITFKSLSTVITAGAPGLDFETWDSLAYKLLMYSGIF